MERLDLGWFAKYMKAGGTALGSEGVHEVMRGEGRGLTKEVGRLMGEVELGLWEDRQRLSNRLRELLVLGIAKMLVEGSHWYYERMRDLVEVGS